MATKYRIALAHYGSGSTHVVKELRRTANGRVAWFIVFRGSEAECRDYATRTAEAV